MPEMDAVLPAAALAATMMMLRPFLRVTTHSSAPLLNCEGIPLQVPLVTPDSESLTTASKESSVTDTSLVNSLGRATVGGVRSMLSATLMGVSFPAVSTADADTTCVVPSLLTVTDAGHVAIATLSPHVKVTVTGPLCQPAALARGVTPAVTVGGVVSIT
jgi:hypothetical protein